jgi:hypothetical protein
MPVVKPVWMLPVIVDGLPTATVDPVLEAKLSTVKVPVDVRATTRSLELAGAVFVRVPLKETVVLTKARGVPVGTV